jgi:hypothetical protein
MKGIRGTGAENATASAAAERTWHYGAMPLAGNVAAIVTALGGLGGLGGLGALISAVRSRSPKDPAGTRPAGQPPAGPGGLARWCLVMGAGACLLAGTLVAAVGTTSVRAGQLPAALLLGGAVAFAVLAIWIGAGILRRGISQKQPELALYASAGLIAACGALAATFIAGTG